LTFFVKCDTCGKIQEAIEGAAHYACNPINEETGQKWYSRVKPDGKTAHACCIEHIPKDELISPI
jgi:hypothetical protein